MQDHDIIELFFARKETALSITAEKYGHSLLRLSENITKSKSDAEKCVSDAYLAAWNAIPPEMPTCLFAWLAKVTRNASLKRLEARASKKRAAETVELSAELCECLPAGEHPLDALESKRLNDVIDGFVRALDEDMQYIFMRRYFFAESIAEIQSATGFSASKIKSKLMRARQKLKEILIKEDFSV